MDPKISCLMANYNTDINYLRAAIDSVLSQSFNNFELIIIDDCSTNGSYEILKEYSIADDRIKLYRNEKNLGLPLSLNRALTYAKCEYVARMDTDDICKSDRFEKQLNYLEIHKLDLIGSETNRMDEHGNIVLRNTNKSYSFETVSELLSVTNCVAHPTWFGKKEVFDALDGYRNIKSCEDYDFLLRAKAAGFKIGIADEALLNYRFNLNSISRKNALRQLLTDNYLSKRETVINKVSADELETFLSKKLSSRNCNKYAVAVQDFEKFCVILSKNKLRAIKYLILALLKSKYVFLNLSKAIRVKRITKHR